MRVYGTITSCFAILLAATLFASARKCIAGQGPTYYFRGHGAGVYMPEAFWIDPYASGTIECDPGFGAGVAAGLDLGMLPIRVEIEGLFQSCGIRSISSDQPLIPLWDDASISVYALMANAYLDFRNPSSFTPYIMAGLGTGHYTIELEEDNAGSDSITVYQMGAGTRYLVHNLSDRAYFDVYLDLGYRYTGSSDPSIGEALGGNYETEFESHQILFGVLLQRHYATSDE